LGAVHYFYPKQRLSVPSRTPHTAELYAGARFPAVFSPEVTLWWDIHKYQGVYVETTLRHGILGNPQGLPFWSVYLSTTLGWNGGQGPNSRYPDQLWHYDERGFTHLDLGFGCNVDLVPGVPGETMLEAHYQFNLDGATKRWVAGSNERHGGTFSIRLSTTWAQFVE
jgi:hypothetical protein